MKIKTLVAVLLLSGGVTSTFAQTENCNSNSSISHEAVRAGNFKDAYAPCMAVLKDCPTLRYYLSLIHIPSPRDISGSRMPSSA